MFATLHRVEQENQLQGGTKGKSEFATLYLSNVLDPKPASSNNFPMNKEQYGLTLSIAMLVQAPLS
jgi:hypothetical protein